MKIAAARPLSTARIIFGFIIAPAVPAAILAFWTFFDGVDNGSYLRTVAMFALYGGYPAAVIFGVPALLVLRRCLSPRFVYALAVGGLVACAPWFLMFLLGDAADYASIDGRPTVLEGERTLFGWFEALKFLGLVFALGAAGGTVFWLVAVGGHAGRSRKANVGKVA